MKGVIWHIYCNQQKGMIRGDDGAGTFPKIGFELNGVSHAFFGPEGQLPCPGRLAWQGSDGGAPVLVEKVVENG